MEDRLKRAEDDTNSIHAHFLDEAENQKLEEAITRVQQAVDRA